MWGSSGKKELEWFLELKERMGGSRVVRMVGGLFEGMCKLW